MEPYFSEKFGNPSSLHSFGQEAQAALDAAREEAAGLVGARFREIIFTGSATEANNLAIQGIARRFKINDSRIKNSFVNHKSKIVHPRVIISAVEHESVREAARSLEPEGAEVVELPVDRRGIADIAKLEKLLSPRTALVSVIYAQNETGAVQPIAEIARLVRDFRSARKRRNSSNSEHRPPKADPLPAETSNIETAYPLFHVDAAQAFQFLPCDVGGLGVDLMTLSAHKIYGPKGVGVLYVKNSKLETRNPKQIQNLKSKKVSNLGFRDSDLPAVSPLVWGGGQEFGLRSGTENVPAAAGFALAARLAAAAREKEAKRLGKIRAEFWSGLKKIFPRAEPNLPEGSPALPNILNVYVPDWRADEFLTRLDMTGIAASSGSACQSRSLEPSPALLAMGYGGERARRSIRFSFGRFTTRGEIAEALRRLSR